MKKTIFYLCFISILFASCDREESAPETCEDTLVCESNCLFTLFNQTGVVSFINCYETWGILFKNEEGYDRIGLVVDMPEEYQIEGKEVTYSAAFYDNHIPFLLPDPPGPAGYRLEVCGIQAQD